MARAIVESPAAALLAVCLGCGSPQLAATPSHPTPPAGVTRYRLPLSGNPLDPEKALRCHARCQEQGTPEGYLECLSRCPGFEQTPGVACAPNEIPPLAACFTARPAPVGSEPRAGSITVAVIGGVALVVGVSSVCASQTEPCSYTGAGLVP